MEARLCRAGRATVLVLCFGSLAGLVGCVGVGGGNGNDNAGSVIDNCAEDNVNHNGNANVNKNDNDRDNDNANDNVGIIDCNTNGIDDEEDIDEGTSEDCNENGVPDECDLDNGIGNDEDNDDCMDECDECPDSNISLTITINDCETGVVNVVIGHGCTFLDLFAQCEADFEDGAGFISCVVDLIAQLELEIEITVEEREALEDCLGVGEDCNDNNVTDEDDIAEGTSEDCDENGVPDECDLRVGRGNDDDNDGVMDECDDCVDSNVNIDIEINNCETGVTNDISIRGCTFLDLFVDCVANFQNTELFIECVADLTARFELEGEITTEEKEAIDACARGD